jgi:hypothetical protein
MRTHCLLLVCSWSLAVLWGEPEGGSFTRTIKREFKNADEEALIKAGEAVIPDRAEVLKAMRKPDLDSKEAGEAKNLWWHATFDQVRVPYAITSDAIQYYSGLIDAFRKGDFSGSAKIKMLKANMNYVAKAEMQEEYEIEGKKFSAVYVVTLELSWSQYCGSTCAMGFQKKRVVVFDKTKKLLGVFLDGKTPFYVS